MAAPWFKFFASDFLLDPKVADLPLEAQAILVRIWCLCWRDGLVPDEPSALARRAMVDSKAFKKCWPQLRAFFESTDGGLLSSRMERERAESQATTESRRRGADKTNSKRWAERSLSDSPSGRSVTRSGVAERHLERVAQASVSDSDSDSEKDKPPCSPPPAKGPVARKRSTVTPKEPESLETILGGGKGTPVWEAFWRLASTFGPAKNPAPKRSARFYAEALGRTGLIPEQIQAKAETLARSVGEPKYMPQLVTWLENGGFLNPEPQPHATPAADGIPDDRRTADVDREFLAQLKSLGA